MSAKILAVSALVLAAQSGWAVNKCTAPDGSVAFQDAPCNAAAKAEGVKTWDSRLTGSAATWKHERNVDAMTGQTSCLVVSPPTYAQQRTRGAPLVPLRLVVSVTTGGASLAVQADRQRDLFHLDQAGAGIKLDALAFVPLDVRSGQHVLGAKGGAAVVQALPNASAVRLRVRLWPFDDLVDAPPLQASGFGQAMRQAQACAG